MKMTINNQKKYRKNYVRVTNVYNYHIPCLLEEFEYVCEKDTDCISHSRYMGQVLDDN